ncbi:MAG: hypothetical protein H6739_35800 [Alphaproteobacteria bacterium]|nr:hypothetical protein [Alphaproteobacteria bacterium]
MNLSRGRLLQEAEALAATFSRFRTPGSGQPVAPALVGQVLRLLQDSPSLEALELYLRALPGSSIAQRTGSSGPQVTEVVRRVRALAGALRDEAPEPEVVEGLRYVLGWTRRLMVAG